MDRRPKIHFTPEAHWMNDPNGMVYIGEQYHLFYQYYPQDIVWGPMHWGHAVSKDLIHWEHKPVALYPDDLGYIFSGSCVWDKDNVSGLGTKDNPPLIAIYTSHGAENGREQQSLAYSLDYEHFEKFKGNPVIPNTEKKDFRDPKIFENPVKGGWSLAIAAGRFIEFYHSRNLREWRKTGEFETGVHGFGGICECPDCFSLETAEGMKWILSVSMILPEEKIGLSLEEGGYRIPHVMQYYVGEFDGDVFRDTMQSKLPLLLDYGTDHYAAVTFLHSPEKLLLGWGENWSYVSQTPADTYRGKMTLARRLKLVRTGEGYRLASTPAGLEQYRNMTRQLEDGMTVLDSNCFGMVLDFPENGSIVFSNPAGEELLIRITGQEILVDRSRSGKHDFCECIGKKEFSVNKTARITSGQCHVELIMDEGFLELFAEDGLLPFSVTAYPSAAFHQVKVEGSAQAFLFTM